MYKDVLLLSLLPYIPQCFHNPTMTTLLLIIGFSLVVSATCSILEAVLLSVTPSHIEILKDEGSRAGVHLFNMKSAIDEPIAAILTLNTIAHTAGATLGGSVATQIFGEVWIGYFTGILTLAILLFSEIIPKTIGAVYWRTLATPSAYLIHWMVILMKPILIPINAFSQKLRTRGGETVSRTDLEALAQIGYSEGTLDEDELKVVTNVIRLDKVSVAEVMTPRTDIVAVDLSASLEDAITIMLNEGHLRLPAYSGSVDDIEGLVIGRDLWQAQRNGLADLSEILRPIQFVPTTKLVEDLLPEMRLVRNQMVIVIDEFGGTAGLVTLEDLIEEIIGEIQDEHEDDEPVPFSFLEDGRIRIWGGVSIRTVNEKLTLMLPEDSHDTLGGYVFGTLHRIGRVGDTIKVDDIFLEIASVRGRRIEYVDFLRTEP